MEAGAKNVKAARALLNLDGAELQDDGAVKGLKEQIKELKKNADTEFLFNSENRGGFTGFAPPEKRDDKADGMTLEKLRSMPPVECLKFSTEHPEEYKSLYDKQ